MEVLLGLASLLLLLLYWLLTPSSNLRRLGNLVPGPKTAPIFGNALNFNVVGTKAFQDLSKGKKEFGPVYRIWLGPRLTLVLFHPDDIQVALTRQSLITKGEVYNVFDTWLGTGLLISSGELWQRRRKAITPTFHFKVLDNFVPVFNKCAETLVSCLKKQAGMGAFDISGYVSNCSLDVISQSAMGMHVEAQKNPQSAYVTSVSKLTKLLGAKINFPWLGVEPIYTLSGQKFKETKRLNIVQDLPRKVLNEKKTTIGDKQVNDEDDMGVKKREAFLERIMKIQQENNITFRNDQDVLDEVTTFMFEGHDTTSVALSYTIWLLGKHKDVQENVYKEVSSIMAHNPKLKIEDLQEMKYLERVIKESLRMYPPVPMIGRRVLEDTTFPSGFTFPAGSDILISISVLHRDPEYFPNPDEFDPDRFLVDQKTHPYAYIPFAAGPRNCIGQKFALLDMKAILAQIVYNYTIATDHDLILDQSLILRSHNGVYVSLSERNESS